MASTPNGSPPEADPKPVGKPPEEPKAPPQNEKNAKTEAAETSKPKLSGAELKAKAKA